MNYTKTGTIISVTPIETLQNGAVKLSYRIDTGDQHNNIWEFEIYKGAEQRVLGAEKMPGFGLA